MKVHAYFLGEPRLLIENEEKMPGKNKLEALLFYLLYHEAIDRREAASVFWPQKDDVRAKSSLRNSLYEIRQSLGVDLFEASTRDRIILSPHIILQKDVELLLDQDQSLELFTLSSHLFMQNRELKDNEVYETWLFSMREAYQSIISNFLSAKLKLAKDNGNWTEVSTLAQRLLTLEPYNEVALRSLLLFYADSYRYNDALNWYLRFKKALEQDLGVEPEPETVKLAEFIQSRKKQIEDHPREAFERSGLLMKLEEAFVDFKGGNGHSSMLVYGDAGSGRSGLIESFIETKSLPLVTLTLDYSNKAIPEGFIIKWAGQFKETVQADFKQLLLNLPQEPLMVVLKNVENMDAASLTYLLDFLSVPQTKLFFMLETTTDFIRGDNAFARAVSTWNLTKIEVPLLSCSELREYINAYAISSGRIFTEAEVTRICRYSRGNLLLANEYIKPQGLKESLFSRLTADFSKDQRKLLEAATVYPGGFTVPMIRIHAGQGDALLEDLRRLLARGLIFEEGGLLMIKYPPLLDWLYNKLPEFYKVALHELAADNSAQLRLSERLDASYRAGHWQKAGNTGKSLFYRLKEIELILDFYDELYPDFVELDDIPDDFIQNRKKYYKLLEGLAKAVADYSENYPSQDASKLEIIVRYLQGRQMIAGGNREDGIEEIRSVIKLATELQDYEYLLKGGIEGIHYAIQKDDPKVMEKFISLCEELINEPTLEFDRRKRAEVLRLEGLYYYGIRNYEEALLKLGQADEILQGARYRKNGFLARAGTLNYLGRTKEAMGDITGTDAAYLAAIALVEGKVHKCLDILYTDYGKFLWLQNREENAKLVLGKALEEYQRLGTHWKRPTAEAIAGLIALGSGNLRSARSHLVNAQIFHKADRRSEEEDLIDRLSRELADQESH